MSALPKIRNCWPILLVFTLTANAQHYEGPIVDLHVHVAVAPGERNTLGGAHSIEDILPLMQPDGVGQVGLITIAHAGNLEETRRRNDSLLALRDKYPAIIPICSVHPADSSSAWEEMARLRKRGVRILKLHPNAQHFDVAAPMVAALAEKAGSLNMALLFDSYNPEDANELGKLMMLAINHPQTYFIFAHMGFVHFLELTTINVWKKYSWYTNNIFMDVSAIAPMLGNSPARDQIIYLIRQIGTGQFIYGSDFPLFTFKESIAAVRQMGFSAEEEKSIFHDNALRLLQLLGN